MNVKEAINRGLNFFAVAVLGIEGFQALFEAITENELIDKIDDLIVVGVAIRAIIWYIRGNNKTKRSFFPGVLLLVVLAAKIGAFFVEHDDAQAIGPDYGILSVIVLTIIIFSWQYYSVRKSNSDK